MQLIPFNLTEAKDTGFFVCGISKSGKTTLCKHIVRTIVDSGISVYVMDVSRAWTQDTPISNVIEVQDNDDVTLPTNTSTVLDLSQLGYEERSHYVNAFTKEIYDWHRDKGYKKAPFEFIIYEEADTYLRSGCFNSPRKHSPLVDLVQLGVNFNLRYGAITQCPSMIDKTVVKTCQQRYFGWITDDDDLGYIKNFTGKEHTDREQPESVFNLCKGQFLYQYGNNIEKIQSSPYESRKCNFTLNGQSVEFAFDL